MNSYLIGLRNKFTSDLPEGWRVNEELPQEGKSLTAKSRKWQTCVGLFHPLHEYDRLDKFLSDFHNLGLMFYKEFYQFKYFEYYSEASKLHHKQFKYLKEAFDEKEIRWFSGNKTVAHGSKY